MSTLSTARLMVVTSAGVIAVATLVPTTAAVGPETPLICLTCGDFWLADCAANVALFVPLGLALSSARCEWWRAVVGAVFLSVLVEALQYQLVPGRDASLRDVLANAAGGGLGWVVLRFTRGLSQAAGQSVWIPIGSGALGGAILVVSAGLLKIAHPSALAWVKGGTELAGYGPFSGVVEGVSLQGAPLQEQTWHRIHRGMPTRFMLQLRSGSPAPWRAEIVTVRQKVGPAWLWVDQHGRDLGVHLASAADHLRLRGQTMWLEDVLPEESGRDVGVEITLRRAGHTVTVATEAKVTEVDVSLSLSDGWRLLSPFSALPGGRLGMAFGGVWLAFVLGPVAWLGALHSDSLGLLLGAACLAGLVGLSASAGFALPSVVSWAGAVGGYGLGMRVGVRHRRKSQ